MNDTEPTMNPYTFRLILLGLDELTPKIVDRLYEAGLDDANLVSRKGVVTADFDRDSESFERAVESAMEDIQRANVGVTGFRLENEDAVVSVAEIARRIGKTRQAVGYYVSGKRGRGQFPRPISDNSGEPLYSWADVADWLQASGMLPEELARDANTRSLIYHDLEREYRRSRLAASAAG
jgi:hypothetical protein